MAKDPDNRLNWRHRVERLDAEIIRDSILAVSGNLNPQIGGKPVFPVLAPEILKQISTGIWNQKKEEGPEVWRRSVYIYRKRTLPFPFLDAFDLPNQNISSGARNITTVPTQALTLMNDDFVLRQSEIFAQRLEDAAPGDKTKQIDRAFPPARSQRAETGRGLPRHPHPCGFHQCPLQPERISLREVIECNISAHAAIFSSKAAEASVVSRSPGCSTRISFSLPTRTPAFPPPA
jgi:hypothetical protein